LGFLEDLLDNLLLLDQERSDNSILNAVGTPGSTVGTRHVLGWLGDVGIFLWSESWDPWEFDSTVTALWCSTLLLDVQVPELSAGGLHNTDPVASGVVPIPSSVGQSAVRHGGDV